MANPKKTIPVVAIGDPGPIQQQIIAAMRSQDEFELVDVLTTSERLAREIAAASPKLIIVDYLLGEQETVDIIDEIAAQFPVAGIIAILPDEDPVKTQQVMLAGARAFLIQPFTQVNLLSTVRRVNELENRRQLTQTAGPIQEGSSKTPVKTIAVFSPRGGVGCSTIAANLAIELLDSTPGRVLLLEGKMFFGHLDVLLNIRSQNTVADLLPHANALDDGLINDVVVRHSSGIEVLLAPSNVQVSQGIRPDDLYSVFVGLDRRFDKIVIDIGSNLTENTVTLMDAADHILLITTPDLAALHDASEFMQISNTLGYPREKILTVLNRDGMMGGIRPQDIEQSLHHHLFARIPDDPINTVRSVNRGIPLVLRYPRSKASKGIRNIADSLMGMTAVRTQAAASPQVTVGRRKEEALLASSRLG